MRTICRRAIALILIPVVVTACYTWQTATPAPRKYLQTHHPARVRVTRTNGAASILWNPELRGDSLRGATAQWDTTRVVTIGLTDVARMDVQRFSAMNTIGLVVIPLSLLVIIGLVAICTDRDSYFLVC